MKAFHISQAGLRPPVAEDRDRMEPATEVAACRNGVAPLRSAPQGAPTAHARDIPGLAGRASGITSGPDIEPSHSHSRTQGSSNCLIVGPFRASRTCDTGTRMNTRSLQELNRWASCGSQSWIGCSHAPKIRRAGLRGTVQTARCHKPGHGRQGLAPDRSCRIAGHHPMLCPPQPHQIHLGRRWQMRDQRPSAQGNGIPRNNVPRIGN